MTFFLPHGLSEFKGSPHEHAAKLAIEHSLCSLLSCKGKRQFKHETFMETSACASTKQLSEI